MTPREQIDKEENLRFPPTKSIFNSIISDVFKEGAEYGYNLAIERVCEYLKFFINVSDEVETNENGEPLADSFIEVNMKRIKAAEEFANNLKQAMKL